MQNTNPTSNTSEDNQALIAVSKSLFDIEFKPLQRPPFKPEQGRSSNEVRWAVCVFVCSSLALFRDMLRSYLVVREQKLEAASFLLARALFETVAAANYVHEQVLPLVTRNRVERAWDLMCRASLGSYYAREHLGPRADRSERPTPLDIGKAVKSLKRFDIHAGAEHSFLSEFSHPDAFALKHYVVMSADCAGFRLYPPEENAPYLRNTVGGTVALAAIVYRSLFSLAELHTALKRFETIMATFLDAERLRPRDGLVPHPSSNKK